MSLLKPRTASFVLYQGDDMARLSELYRALKRAEESAAQSGEDARAGDDEPSVVRERQSGYDEFVDEAAERAVTVTVQFIGRRRHRDLMAEHPPRMVKVPGEPVDLGRGESLATEREEMHEDDVQFGVNADTFPMALMTYVDPDNAEVRTLAEPEFDSPTALVDFLEDEVSEDDFYTWWTTAYYLNTVQSADPKAARSSTTLSSLET